MFRIVLDTNVLLVSISSKSRLHWIFRKLVAGEFFLCVTTEILSEYAEIIERYMGEEASVATMGVLENLPNLVLITTYFRFNLLNDEDDNKFSDCAVAANADFIVSHDKDFKILNSVSFPKIQVIDTITFESFLMTP
ncbi:MAG: putative toxin-antitoxin system toxin component, PIN family [Lewinellaceae bacterium]|nr:putative toxin-antitoxin system toxin component, PIN family [Lewinellaceae bacterium]